MPTSRPSSIEPLHTPDSIGPEHALRSLAEAREFAAKDPMHSSGARKFTVRPWLVNEGTITIKLNYAKASFEVS